MNPLLIEAYLSLTAVIFTETRSINEVLKIYDNIPVELDNNDLLIQQKSALYLESGNFDKSIEVANTISNKILKDNFILRIKNKVK